MSKKNEAWGVEVGAQAIKLMKLARTGNGVAMEDFEVLPFKHVLTTPDLNVEEAIRVNLDALAHKYEFDKSTVVVSVPGHMAFARFAKLPPIEASKVKSIVAYEAQQQIPFPIDEVEWDYQVFAQEDAPDIEVGIFAITKERVAQFLSNYRSVNMNVDMLTLSPVAVYNAFAYETESAGDGDNSVYLDIGTVSTDIIVVESGGIWLRTLPLGGNHFTNALMKQFKISFAKAEKLKLEASTSKYAKQIFQAMRGVFSDLVSEIQRSLGFYQSLNRDSELTRIVGVGSTWKLPGLQKYLKQNLQMDVVRPDGFERLQVDGRRAAEFSSVAVNMATAYGLALQGLGLASVDANILPQAILRQRMWKAKQPWFGAAAACIAGAAAVGPITMLMAGSSFSAAWQRAEPDITSTNTEGQQLKSTYDTEVVAEDPRPGIRNLRRSFDYTNLEPKLLEDIAAAMASIPTNPALREVDWSNPADVERVAQVPRSERQQVWVTHMVQTYKMPTAAETASSTAVDPMADPSMSGPSSMDARLGGYDRMGSMGLGDSGGSQAAAGIVPQVPFPAMAVAADPGYEDVEGEAAEPAEPDLSALPRIVVTVRGETTMNSQTISRLLQEHFVGWLEEHAERSDRPYILVSELSETDFKQRSRVTGTETGGRGGPGSLSQPGGTGGIRKTPAPKQPETQPGLGGGLGSPGVGTPRLGDPRTGIGGGIQGDLRSGGVSSIEVKTPEGWYAQLGANSGGFSVDALLPRRPLSVEDDTNDTVFTFNFEVILLPPDEARKTILPRPETDGAGGEGQGPTASNNERQEQDS